MPYYQITILLKNQKKISAIRSISEHNIDKVYREYEIKARKYYTDDLSFFRVAMLSTLDVSVKKILSKKTSQREGPNDVDPAMLHNRNTKFKG